MSFIYTLDFVLYFWGVCNILLPFPLAVKCTITEILASW